MIDIRGICDSIPHRYPFLLIDRVLEVEPGKRAVALKNVTANEHFFEGHFPGRPAMPGVMIVEAMAQAGAILLLGDPARRENKLVYFMSIDDARFRRPVIPGDVLRLEVKILRHREKVWKFAGQAKVDGALAAEATYTAMIMEN